MPHDHQHVLATYHKAEKDQAFQAIDIAMETWKIWSNTSLSDRVNIFAKQQSCFKVHGEMN